MSKLLDQILLKGVVRLKSGAARPEERKDAPVMAAIKVAGGIDLFAYGKDSEEAIKNLHHQVFYEETKTEHMPVDYFTSINHSEYFLFQGLLDFNPASHPTYTNPYPAGSQEHRFYEVGWYQGMWKHRAIAAEAAIKGLAVWMADNASDPAEEAFLKLLADMKADQKRWEPRVDYGKKENQDGNA